MDQIISEGRGPANIGPPELYLNIQELSPDQSQIYIYSSRGLFC